MRQLTCGIIAVIGALAGAHSAAAPLRITPEIMTFVAAKNQSPDPQTLSVWLDDRSQHWVASEDVDWLSLTPASGDGAVAGMTARVAVNAAGLAPSRYEGEIAIRLEGEPDTQATLKISLHVVDAPTVRDIGDRKQLFIDRRFIEQEEGITLKVNPPRKLGIIRDAEGREWKEGFHVNRVLEQDGKFRLYHGVQTNHVAESNDGVHWTNVAEIPLPGTIFIDPRDVPERRYKLFAYHGHEPFQPETDGIMAHASSDGLQFKPEGRVVPLFIDNPQVAYWDERVGRYVIFTRALAAPETEWDKAHGVENQRRVARIETDDLLAPWPLNPEVPLDYSRYWMTHRHIPVIHMADEKDYRWSDIYYNATYIYPWAQDVYLMFNAHFAHFRPEYHTWIEPRQEGLWEDFGLLEIQLAVSRDGIHWERPERIPYIPMGRADEWDRWLVYAGPGMIRKGNDLFQYYGSSGRTHDSLILRPEEYAEAAPRMGGIGVVQQRLDGFVSADADENGGWLETPPLVFQGNRLRLNIDTGSMGTAYVELRDAGSQPIPGFELDACQEVMGNYVDYKIRWKIGEDVSSLAGKPVKLYFKLTRAKLYGFQFLQE